MASRRPSVRLAIVSLLILSLVLIGIGGLIFRTRLNLALQATARVQAAATGGDLKGTCSELQAANEAWQRVAAISTPLASVFYHLGWVPTVGHDLRLLPTAVVLAESGTAAGAGGCRVFAPVLDATTLSSRLAGAAEQISQHPQALPTLINHLKRAQAASVALTPHLEQSTRLAVYREPITALGPQLGRALEILEALQRFGPDLPWLLGMDDPRRFLIVIQNPFELRPTGGFMGLVCVLRVEQAQPGVEQCRTSEAYASPAPAGVEMPSPYGRYLHFGRYYLRDANWSPDFPTTAQRIQEFWAWNGQAPVDGVIATDLYALGPVVAASGPLELDDGTKVAGERVMDTILTRYYDGRVRRDKAGISELLPSLLDQVLQADQGSLGRLAQSLGTILAERHLLISINKPAVMDVLADHGWDGGLYARRGDGLRIVDADVGYGGVNAFVDRLSHYDVVFDDEGTPLTATLTLTYTNHYSPWAEATTAHAVYGKCTDPETLQLERRPGCFANYVRVYVPEGSRLLDIKGFDEPFEADLRYDRAVFGGYVRVLAGESREIRLTYRLPESARGSLMIEKQPGTAAPSYHVVLRRGAQHADAWVNGQTDVLLRTRVDALGIAIDGPQDEAAVPAFEHAARFAEGLRLWDAGKRAEAGSVWMEGQVIDRALDYARVLADRGDREAAQALVDVLASDRSARAAFEQAIFVESQDPTAAQALYGRAAELSPDNPLAQLMFMRSLAAGGQPMPAPQADAISASAIRRWREAAFDLERSSKVSEAADYWQALLVFTPNDDALVLHAVELLLETGRTGAARRQLDGLAADDDIWGRLAGARLAVLDGAPETAIARYHDAFPLATDYDTLSEIGNGLRDLGDAAGAQQAFEQAANLAPDSIWPLVAIGDLLRESDPAAARTWYERARQLDPNTGYQLESGYPDYALGRLLADTGDDIAALPLLEAAVEKEPDRHEFRALLEEVRARLGGS